MAINNQPSFGTAKFYFTFPSLIAMYFFHLYSYSSQRICWVIKCPNWYCISTVRSIPMLPFRIHRTWNSNTKFAGLFNFPSWEMFTQRSLVVQNIRNRRSNNAIANHNFTFSVTPSLSIKVCLKFSSQPANTTIDGSCWTETTKYADEDLRRVSGINGCWRI